MPKCAGGKSSFIAKYIVGLAIQNRGVNKLLGIEFNIEPAKPAGSSTRYGFKKNNFLSGNLFLFAYKATIIHHIILD